MTVRFRWSRRTNFSPVVAGRQHHVEPTVLTSVHTIGPFAFLLLAVVPLAVSCGADSDAGPVCSFEGEALPEGETRVVESPCQICTCIDQTISCEPSTQCPASDAGPTDTGEDTNPSDDTSDGGEDNGTGSDVPDVPDESDVADATDAADDTDADMSDSCMDRDFDGYFTCVNPNFPDRPTEVDCDDERFSVQPNGYEFPGNERDDDCDGDIDEPPDCECNTSATASGRNLAQAIEICGGELDQVELGGAWDQYGVLEDYFGLPPRSGDCLGVISTGSVDPGIGGLEPGDGFNGTDTDPDPDGVGEEVFDLAPLTMELHPPRNALGFRFDFMFLSAEWPEFLCQSFNDTFYAIVRSAEIRGGMPTNISFDRNNQEITVNVGFFELPAEWTTDLTGTPIAASDGNSGCATPSAPGCMLPEYCSDSTNDFGYIGSGSGWLTTQAPIRMGEETIYLTFSIHDEGDDAWDSIVLIDNFQWLPFRTSVGTVKEE